MTLAGEALPAYGKNGSSYAGHRQTNCPIYLPDATIIIPQGSCATEVWPVATITVTFHCLFNLCPPP